MAIKIISDGTLAGTEIRDADTDAKISNVFGVTLAIGTRPDGSRYLYATVKVRNPIIEINNLEASIETG